MAAPFEQFPVPPLEILPGDPARAVARVHEAIAPPEFDVIIVDEEHRIGVPEASARPVRASVPRLGGGALEAMRRYFDGEDQGPALDVAPDVASTATYVDLTDTRYRGPWGSLLPEVPLVYSGSRVDENAPEAFLTAKGVLPQSAGQNTKLELGDVADLAEKPSHDAERHVDETGSDADEEYPR